MLFIRICLYDASYNFIFNLQAQLRTFIPLMLKYSTGRGKPGWGRESTRPAWWPKELPWANVRSDARTDEDKQKVSLFLLVLFAFCFC